MSKKNTSSNKKNLDVLKVEILFYTMTNMMIIFHFMIIMLKTPILKVDLNMFFFLNAYICMRCSILQNGLQIDVILIFQNFQINEKLKDTYVLSNYACYNHNISKF
jgi:hypothetical protein